MKPYTQNILVIEDNPVVVKSLEAALKTTGCHISSTSSLDKAWDYLNKERFDLVITDILLPNGHSGYQLAEFLRSTHRYAKLPIIVISSLNTKDDVEKAIRSGANDYIVKPVDIDILLSKVGLFLGRKTDSFSSVRCSFDAKTLLNCRITSVSEVGMTITGDTMLTPGDFINIEADFLKQIGISNAKFRVHSSSAATVCKNGDFIYQSVLHFSGLTPTNRHNLRAWIFERRREFYKESP